MRRFTYHLLAAIFVAVVVPVSGGDENSVAPGRAGVLNLPAQITSQINIGNQRLETTAMQYNTSPLTVPIGVPIKVLEPLTVNCPGSRPCTFEFTTTAQIGSGTTSDEYWAMAASVDGAFADGSYFVVSPVPTYCCEQRTTELFEREITPGQHTVQMWVVSPGTPATIIYRSMVIRVFTRL
jgi:hypothetical protein